MRNSGYRIMRRALLLLAMGAVSDTAAAGQAKPEAKAPPIQCDKWIGLAKNLDPAKPDGKTVFLLEFWSPSDPQSLLAIPLMNRIHDKFKNKGVAVLAITADPEASVESVVNERKIRYAVGLDSAKGTWGLYMLGDALPPFVVILDKRGNPVWRGPAGNTLPRILARILAGKWTAEDNEKSKALYARLNEAITAQDLAAAQSALHDLAQFDPENPQTYLAMVQLLSQAKRQAEIPAVIEAWSKGCAKSAEGLAQQALFLVNVDNLALRDLSLALESAKKAAQLGAGKEVLPIQALARVYTELGLFEKAVATLDAGERTLTGDEAPAIQGMKAYYQKLIELRKSLAAGTVGK